MAEIQNAAVSILIQWQKQVLVTELDHIITGRLENVGHRSGRRFNSQLVKITCIIGKFHFDLYIRVLGHIHFADLRRHIRTRLAAPPRNANDFLLPIVR